MTYYKILGKGHTAIHGGKHTYDTPCGTRPGKWSPRVSNPALCHSGWHYSNADDLVRYLWANSDDLLPLEVWECEVDSGTYGTGKGVAERIRLTRLVGTIDEYDLRWLGTVFAERVLCNTDDPRVGECINAVRAYLLGFLDRSDLSAAWLAARSAAWSAAESAAWSAAESAAWSAASRDVLDYLGGGTA